MRTYLAAILMIGGAGAVFLTLPAHSQPSTVLRYPVALALTADGRWLFTANQRSGSISALALASGKLVSEWEVGRQLADLALTADGRHLLAVDEKANELIVLGRQEAALTVRCRVPVPPGPSSVTTDGTTGFVASPWQRQLTVLDLAPLTRNAGPPRVLGRHTLPFAPRVLRGLPGTGKLVLADAFGGRLALFDSGRGQVESVRLLPAHNIRGLALSPDGQHLLVTHQVLHRLGETTRDNVHWGNVITNNLRVLALTNVLDPKAELLHGARLHQLGEAGRGSGDPAGVVATAGGTLVVALAGVGEIALGPDRLGNWDRIKVGRRPMALAASPDGRRVYVANTFDDSISVLDVQARSVLAHISLGPRPLLSARARGEHLFYDARLAHDGWMSCHSCHTDGHSNGLLSDTLGDGSFGAAKRVPSLLGVRDTAPYAWNGGVSDLATQVRKSVATTMHGPPLSEGQVRDLVEYLGTLASAPVRAELPDEQRVRRGRDVFAKQGCAVCHAPPTYTSGKTYDVGLRDELGNRQFNPPSLRGVGQAQSFFHDGRAASLEDVFTRHGHQLKGALPGEELQDLLAFLRTL